MTLYGSEVSTRWNLLTTSLLMKKKVKMYPFGFHCIDDDGGEQVLKFDSKSQDAVYKDIYKYSMGKALYHGDENKPFGCELLLTGNGEKRIVTVYLSDDGPLNLDDVRYEHCNDKDLIFEVIGKSLKKNKANIRYKNEATEKVPLNGIYKQHQIG